MSWIKNTINNTPILKDDFEGFIFKANLSTSKMNEFIRLFYNGTVSDVLKFKHKMHDNYTQILEYADEQVKNAGFVDYEDMVRKGSEAKNKVQSLQKTI